MLNFVLVNTSIVWLQMQNCYILLLSCWGFDLVDKEKNAHLYFVYYRQRSCCFFIFIEMQNLSTYISCRILPYCDRDSCSHCRSPCSYSSRLREVPWENRKPSSLHSSSLPYRIFPLWHYAHQQPIHRSKRDQSIQIYKLSLRITLRGFSALRISPSC